MTQSNHSSPDPIKLDSVNVRKYPNVNSIPTAKTYKITSFFHWFQHLPFHQKTSLATFVIIATIIPIGVIAVQSQIRDRSKAYDGAMFPTNNNSLTCVPAGCNGQLCVDATIAKDLVTTCEINDTNTPPPNMECKKLDSGSCNWVPKVSDSPTLFSPQPVKNIWWYDMTENPVCQQGIKSEDQTSIAIRRYFDTQDACQENLNKEYQRYTLWWFDNDHQTCSQKEFIGEFAYYGLQTFHTEPECLTALATTHPSPSPTTPGSPTLFSPQPVKNIWWYDMTENPVCQQGIKSEDQTSIAIRRYFDTQDACQENLNKEYQRYTLWWFDNDHQTCSQKEFIGEFAYYGLQTFHTEPECLTKLTTTFPSNSSSPTPKPTSTPTPTSSNSSRCEAAPPSGSPDLYQINVTTTTATLYFAPANKPYTYYLVQYGANGNMQQSTTFMAKDVSGALRADIHALSPRTNYTFRVTAFNDCAAGSWSNEMKINTEATKTYYKNIFASTKANVSKVLGQEDKITVLQVTTAEEKITTSKKMTSPTFSPQNQMSPTPSAASYSTTPSSSSNPALNSITKSSWFQKVMEFIINLFIKN